MDVFNRFQILFPQFFIAGLHISLSDIRDMKIGLDKKQLYCKVIQEENC